MKYNHNVKKIETIDPCSLIPTVNWEINNVCNFNCSYCGAKDIMQMESFDASILKINSFKKFEVDFNLIILGGEPTLHPKINKIVELCLKVDQIKRLTMFTNGSKFNVIDSLLDMCEKMDLEQRERFKIIYSFHPEYHNQIFFDKIRERVKRFEELGMEYRILASIELNKPNSYYENTDNLLYNNKDLNIYSNFILDDNFAHGYDVPDYMVKYGRDFKFSCGDRGRVIFEDGTEEILNSFEIYYKTQLKFKGFKCNPIYFYTTNDDKIINYCTNRQVNYLTQKNIEQNFVCSHDCCPMMRGGVYFKTKDGENPSIKYKFKKEECSLDN